MAPSLSAVAFLAPDYDAAIAWFRDCLGFAVLEDQPLSPDKRWVVVGARSGEGARFIVAKAVGDQQLAAVGAQAGGRVGYFLETDDFARDFARFNAKGVEFLEDARARGLRHRRGVQGPLGRQVGPDRAGPRGRPMPLQRQIALWAIAACVIAVVIDTLGSGLAPFAVGIAVGYLLNPVADRLQRAGLSRLAASLIILLAFVGVVALAGVTLVPALLRQIAQFSTKLPGYVETLQTLAANKGSELLTRYGGPWLQQFGLGDTLTPAQMHTAVADLVSRSGAWSLAGLSKLAVGGAALVGFLSFLVVAPVVAFYILIDWHNMVDTVDSWLPRDHRAELRQIAREINVALAGFLRGQFLVCVFLGVWDAAGLSLIGLDFALLIGFIGGLLSFIPYVGSLTALVLALGVAVVQKWPDMHLLLMSFLVVGAGEFLESYVISPKLVGESIGLHPIWLIFALFAFGELFGFTGLLVAVPTAAALGVIVRHLIRSYQMSPYYRGRSAAGA